MNEKDIVQAAVEEKLIELELMKKIAEKARSELESKLSVQKKEWERLLEDISKCKSFLHEYFNEPPLPPAAEPEHWEETKEQEQPAAEQIEQTDGREEEMSPGAKSDYDKARYRKRKKLAADEKEPAPQPAAESMDEILAKAKEAGLSYGQYLAQRDIQRQSEEMAEARARRKLLSGGN